MQNVPNVTPEKNNVEKKTFCITGGMRTVNLPGIPIHLVHISKHIHHSSIMLLLNVMI